VRTRLPMLAVVLTVLASVLEASTMGSVVASADSRVSTRSRPVSRGIAFVRVVADGGLVRAFVLRVDPARYPIDVAVADHGLDTVLNLANQHRALAAINGDLDVAGELMHPLIEDGSIAQFGLRTGHVFAVDAAGQRAYVGRNRPHTTAATPDSTDRIAIARWNIGWPTAGALVAYDSAAGYIRAPVGSCSVRVLPSATPRWSAAGGGIVRNYLVDRVECPTDRLAPHEGVVLSARAGSAAAAWISELRPDGSVSLRSSVGWPWVLDLQGGTPLLLRDGRVVAPRSCASSFCVRQPRTGVGVTPGCEDGLATTRCRVLYAVVDGRRPGWSIGMRLDAFARLLRALGASSALNFDGGASTTMVVRGRVVNRPADGTLRAVPSAMLVLGGPDVSEPSSLVAGPAVPGVLSSRERLARI
jgi:Phosphodiester glycosidase